MRARVNITTAMSPAEADAVEREAHRHGVSVSEYTRRLLMADLARQAAVKSLTPGQRIGVAVGSDDSEE